MTDFVSSSTPPERPPVLSVIVLSEDRATRDHALLICTHLASNLGGEVEFEIHPWQFQELLEPKAAWDSAELAARAQLIVYSMHHGREVPPVVRSWSESWADSRGNETGAIAGLIGLTASEESWKSARHDYLRQLAARAGMDYLPQGLFTAEAASVDAGQPAKATPQTSSIAGAFLPNPFSPAAPR